TLRRHLQSMHKGSYLTWVKNTPGAVNKLPNFLAQQRKEVAEKLQQSRLTEHFEKAEPQEHAIPYSDERFKEAAIEWLIATDQPIQALDHPKFHEMIDLASQAKNGVK
ncbi:hypothetical protein M422DRAFT_84981, partial [Sphaerobolus stellatus SS14]